ncbi:MAG: right-handed parallel beta-helix repeat-containing protein [Planctomycetota bacterium]
MKDLRRLNRFLIAFLTVILTAFSVTAAESYDPPWSTVEPDRIVRVAANADATDTENGERLYHAISRLKPGDRLEIDRGTYSVDRLWDLKVSGTADSPIWIVAAPGKSVLITRPDRRQNILNVGQRQPVKFLCLRGIEFTGGSHGIRLGRCSDVWIDRCHIHHTNEVCLSANTADTARIHITRNTIHDGNGTAEGMYLGGNHAKVIMSKSVIALNHVYNCRGSQGDGIELKQGSWGNLIAENRVHDTNYPCITVYGTGGKQQNVIEKNICYRSRDSVMQVQGEAIVRNNVLIDGRHAAFNSTDHQGKTLNLQVIHNTLINTSHGLRGGSWNMRRNMVLANNVIYSRTQNDLHFPNGKGGVNIIGNVLLGDGPRAGSQLGRGLEDFQALTWDGVQRDATPTGNAPFGCGAESFRLPGDLSGTSRKNVPIVAGAVEQASDL